MKKWNFWFTKHRWERGMDAELKFHLDSLIASYLEQGLTREEAERRARRAARLDPITALRHE